MVSRIARFGRSTFTLIVTLTVFGILSPLSAQETHVAAQQYQVCAATLTPVDNAPGDLFTEHKKNLFAYDTSTDVTQLFIQGKATISYSDQNYNILGGFDNTSSDIGAQSLNQWGLRTRWAIFHQDFTTYHWLALWNC